MSGFETAMRENAEGVGDFIERNTRSISGRGGGDGGGSDSAEANYSSSRSASKSGGQGGKKDSTLKGKKNKQNLSKRALIKKKQ